MISCPYLKVFTYFNLNFWNMIACYADLLSTYILLDYFSCTIVSWFILIIDFSWLIIDYCRLLKVFLHGQGVVVAGLEDHFVFEDDQGEDFEAGVDTEEFEREVEGEVNHVEAGVIGQGEDERVLQRARQDLQFDARLARDGHRRAQQAQDPRFDVVDVVHHERWGRLRRLTRQ